MGIGNEHIQNCSDDIYKSLFDNSSYAKLLVDSDGLIIRCNHSFTNMFGYTESELLNKNISILIPEKYKSTHGEHLEGYFKSPSKKVVEHGREIEAQKKDGSLYSSF